MIATTIALLSLLHEVHGLHVSAHSTLRAPVKFSFTAQRISRVAAQLDESAFSALVEYGATHGWRDELDNDIRALSAHDDSQLSVAQDEVGGKAPPSVCLTSELESRFTTPSMQLQAGPSREMAESSTAILVEPATFGLLDQLVAIARYLALSDKSFH